MNRVTIAVALGLIAAVPAGAAHLYFGNDADTGPCFAAPGGAFRIADKAADYIVRVDDVAEHPSLRLQIVDDPAAADFVLVDDGVAACPTSTKVTSIRIDPTAALPDVTVALTHMPADKKIYVKSARFSEQDAAALFAVIGRSERRTVAAHILTR
jgi:hypothetical protein